MANATFSTGGLWNGLFSIGFCRDCQCKSPSAGAHPSRPSSHCDVTLASQSLALRGSGSGSSPLTRAPGRRPAGAPHSGPGLYVTSNTAIPKFGPRQPVRGALTVTARAGPTRHGVTVATTHGENASAGRRGRRAAAAAQAARVTSLSPPRLSESTSCPTLNGGPAGPAVSVRSSPAPRAPRRRRRNLGGPH